MILQKRNRAKMIITMRNSEKEILEEVLREKGFELIPYEVKPNADDMRKIIARYIKYFNVSIAGIPPDEACRMIESERMSTLLDKAIGLLIEKSNNAPSYIRHLMHEHRNGTLCMEEIKTIYIGNKNIMCYVLAIAAMFNEGADIVVLKGRGRAIARAVDTAEAIRNRFLPNVKVEEIITGTEELVGESGEKISVISIEIWMRRL